MSYRSRTLVVLASVVAGCAAREPPPAPHAPVFPFAPATAAPAATTEPAPDAASPAAEGDEPDDAGAPRGGMIGILSTTDVDGGAVFDVTANDDAGLDPELGLGGLGVDASPPRRRVAPRSRP